MQALVLLRINFFSSNQINQVLEEEEEAAEYSTNPPPLIQHHLHLLQEAQQLQAPAYLDLFQPHLYSLQSASHRNQLNQRRLISRLTQSRSRMLTRRSSSALARNQRTQLRLKEVRFLAKKPRSPASPPLAFLVSLKQRRPQTQKSLDLTQRPRFQILVDYSRATLQARHRPLQQLQDSQRINRPQRQQRRLAKLRAYFLAKNQVLVADYSTRKLN